MQVVFYLLMVSMYANAPSTALTLHDTPVSCEVAKQQVESLKSSSHRYICVKGVR